MQLLNRMKMKTRSYLLGTLAALCAAASISAQAGSITVKGSDTMGSCAETAVSQAVAAVIERDGTLARRVCDSDDTIDGFEVDIDEMSILLLAKAPLASDLRLITVAMVGFPYDDLDAWRAIYPPEVFIKQFDAVASGFKSALDQLKASTITLLPDCSSEEKRAFESEYRVAEAA